MPQDRQEIFARLAVSFEEASDMAIFLSPMELTEKLGIGNRQLWQEFINFEPVVQFIRAELAQAASVASRKTFQSLNKEAITGNVQAARQINELAGVFGSGDRNKIIVLHRIDRGNRDGN